MTIAMSAWHALLKIENNYQRNRHEFCDQSAKLFTSMVGLIENSTYLY